ncbi:MAG: hypothetical protein EZS28_016820 [Streblomastix strix]|uniref:Uncharacterized protein n=1 Tax=Streblomastix strix TaxID=222440 RepID=A0A5J4VZH6_9EUKA|nr:MAG: hypothetical protein EZS28_016820 [Streblomastix strix]
MQQVKNVQTAQSRINDMPEQYCSSSWDIQNNRSIPTQSNSLCERSECDSDKLIKKSRSWIQIFYQTTSNRKSHYQNQTFQRSSKGEQQLLHYQQYSQWRCQLNCIELQYLVHRILRIQFKQLSQSPLQLIAKFKICKIPEERINPLSWIKSWYADREPNIPNKEKELRRISYLVKYVKADDFSKTIRAVMQSAGISETYLDTYIRAVATTELLKHNVSSVYGEWFTNHFDSASTIRQYHDKNNIVESREMFSQTEEELYNEKDEEQERILLEEIRLERINVEQRTQSPVRVLSPGQCHMEFSQFFSSIHITQSQSSVEIENTFQPFLQYSRIPVKVEEDQKGSIRCYEYQRKSQTLRSFQQLENQQIIEELTISAGGSLQPGGIKAIFQKKMSSSFVLSHQNVPTFRNFWQMESSKVQTTSGADEEHETPMQNENEIDDS